MHNSEDILQRLTRIEGQLDRIVSDIESEKGIRKERSGEIERRLRTLEDYKANLQGRITVTLVVGGSIWGLIIILITFLIRNKT